MNNLYLIISAVAVIYLISKKFAFIGNKNVKNVSAKEAHNLIKENKDVVIIDVRTPSEFKSGHIVGAKSVPVGNIQSELYKLEKFKDKPIIVHCASGGRSPSAVKVLLKNGFNNIYHMKRGLVGWKYGLK